MEPQIMILVAEDEYLIGLTVQEVLEEAGFAVHYAISGREAIEAVAGDRPHVSGLVTDIRLGAGPSGWDVAKAAREANPSLPIVFMTGDSAHQYASMGVSNSKLVQKPFEPAQIVAALKLLIDKTS